MKASTNNQGEAGLDSHTLHRTLIWQLHFYFHGRWAAEGHSILPAVGLVRSSRCPVDCRTLGLPDYCCRIRQGMGMLSGCCQVRERILL